MKKLKTIMLVTVIMLSLGGASYGVSYKYITHKQTKAEETEKEVTIEDIKNKAATSNDQTSDSNKVVSNSDGAASSSDKSVSSSNEAKSSSNKTDSNSNKETSNSKITSKEAKELILKEDAKYISKRTKNKDKNGYYCKLSDDYQEYSADKMPVQGWDVPKESCYQFTIDYYDDKGEKINGLCEYLVGVESKNVYCMPSQGGMPAYQIKDNKIVETFKYSSGGSNVNWHK